MTMKYRGPLNIKSLKMGVGGWGGGADKDWRRKDVVGKWGRLQIDKEKRCSLDSFAVWAFVAPLRISFANWGRWPGNVKMLKWTKKKCYLLTSVAVLFYMLSVGLWTVCFVVSAPHVLLTNIFQMLQIIIYFGPWPLQSITRRRQCTYKHLCQVCVTSADQVRQWWTSSPAPLIFTADLA